MKKLFYALTLLLSVGFYSSCGSKTEKSEATQETEITWATFNIRLDTEADSMRAWQYRRDTMANYIKAQDLDIIGMQEVVYNQLLDLHERLPEYSYVGVGREDGKTKGEHMNIFFKTDKFELLDSDTFWLSQYPDSVGFIGWDGACPRVATWAKLKDKATDKVFMAVNTHFDHIGVEARKNGALLIMEKIKEVVGDQPAVLTGDFNVNDQSDAYATLTNSAFKLLDSHKIAEETTGGSYTYHGYNRAVPEEMEKIDFVFVTPTIHVKSSFIPQQVEGLDGPFMSDHNPIIVKLSF